ncbi:hypothetical protein OAE79_02900, partial [Rhodopirellula sp.]
MRLKIILHSLAILVSCDIAVSQDTYHCLDHQLDLKLIRSDTGTSYISLDVENSGNLVDGDRNALHLLAAEDDKGCKS